MILHYFVIAGVLLFLQHIAFWIVVQQRYGTGYFGTDLALCQWVS